MSVCVHIAFIQAKPRCLLCCPRSVCACCSHIRVCAQALSKEQQTESKSSIDEGQEIVNVKHEKKNPAQAVCFVLCVSARFACCRNCFDSETSPIFLHLLHTLLQCVGMRMFCHSFFVVHRSGVERAVSGQRKGRRGARGRRRQCAGCRCVCMFLFCLPVIVVCSQSFVKITTCILLCPVAFSC